MAEAEFENRRMPAHPGGIDAAARKSPFAGDAVAAVDDNGLCNTRGRPIGFILQRGRRDGLG
jgi:hypothetical protein